MEACITQQARLYLWGLSVVFGVHITWHIAACRATLRSVQECVNNSGALRAATR
jgi:hypothetical protein